MFDPYHKWLGIPKDRRPPTYYDLLGIAVDEDDVEVIDSAALRQIAHVRTFQAGSLARECAQLLNELALARRTLTTPERRAKYDAQIAAGGPRVVVEVDEEAGPRPPAIVVAEEPLLARRRGSLWALPTLVVAALFLAGLWAVAHGWFDGPAAPSTNLDGSPPRETAVERPRPTPVEAPRRVQETKAAEKPAVKVETRPAEPVPTKDLIARLGPRPNDDVLPLPDAIDPNTPVLELLFEPDDAQVRVICDRASEKALVGPGRHVEYFTGTTRASQALVSLTRPGHAPLIDRPVRLEAGKIVTIRAKLGANGTGESSLLQYEKTTPLTGPSAAWSRDAAADRLTTFFDGEGLGGVTWERGTALRLGGPDAWGE